MSTPNRVSVLLQHPQGRAFVPLLIRFAKGALSNLNLKGRELSICLASDSYLRALNRRWRQRDTPTDVLSFPSGPTPVPGSGRQVLGDVVISLDTARARARPRKAAIERELKRYLTHGLLHLLGYDHHTSAQAAQMASLERRIIGGVGLVPAKR